MYRRHKALIQNSVWPYGSVYGVFGNEFCASGTIRALFKTGLACLRRCVWRQVLIGWRSSASQTVARGQTLQVELFYSWGLEHDVYVVSHTHTHTHTNQNQPARLHLFHTIFTTMHEVEMHVVMKWQEPAQSSQVHSKYFHRTSVQAIKRSTELSCTRKRRKKKKRNPKHSNKHFPQSSTITIVSCRQCWLLNKLTRSTDACWTTVDQYGPHLHTHV